MQKGGSMKRARRQSLLVFLVSTIVCIGFYGVRSSTQYLLKQAPISVHHDPLLSDSYIKNLETQLTQNIHTYGPSHLMNHYQQYAPILSAVTIQYSHPLHATVTYDLVAPYACFNDTMGLLPNGTLIPTDIFTPEFIETIPHIKVPMALLSQSELPETLKSCFKNMPADIQNRFHCTWHDEHTCHYHDHANPLYTLVYEGYTPPTQKDVALYDAVIAQYIPRNKKDESLIDLRFKNQVIISHGKGS
jgi:hypothetical protein